MGVFSSFLTPLLPRSHQTHLHSILQGPCPLSSVITPPPKTTYSTEKPDCGTLRHFLSLRKPGTCSPGATADTHLCAPPIGNNTTRGDCFCSLHCRSGTLCALSYWVQRFPRMRENQSLKRLSNLPSCCLYKGPHSHNSICQVSPF